MNIVELLFEQFSTDLISHFYTKINSVTFAEEVKY